MNSYETDLVFGVFKDEESLQSALDDLLDLEYDTGDVSIVMLDEKRAEQLAADTGMQTVGDDAAKGAAIGGAAGVLLGLAAAALPGGILVAGPAAIALGLTGAAAGGITGALVGMGVSEEDATRLESRLVEGDILVAVPSFDVEEVIAIMEDNDADDIDVLSITPTDEYQYNPWLSEQTRNSLAEGHA